MIIIKKFIQKENRMKKHLQKTNQVQRKKVKVKVKVRINRIQEVRKRVMKNLKKKQKKIKRGKKNLNQKITKQLFIKIPVKGKTTTQERETVREDFLNQVRKSINSA